MIDIVEILVHWHAGRKKADVARSLGVDRATIAKYTAKAESEGYVPGGEQLSLERWAELAHGWFPKLVDPRQRSLTHATIDAHRSEIEQMLKTNTATTVHQRLRDEHGLKVGISSFRRYVWREFPEENLRNIATPPRPDVPAGEEGQVDYGYLGSWFDQLAERARRVWAFVMVLACSRHMFVRPVLSKCNSLPVQSTRHSAITPQALRVHGTELRETWSSRLIASRCLAPPPASAIRSPSHFRSARRRAFPSPVPSPNRAPRVNACYTFLTGRSNAFSHANCST